MAPFTRGQASQTRMARADSQDDASPFVSVSTTDQTETPDELQTPASADALSRDIYLAAKITTPNSPYTLRVQSCRFYDDQSPFFSQEIKDVIKRDLFNRVTEANEGLLAEIMFPDHAFGFPVNTLFIMNFYNSFLSDSGSLDPANFGDEESTVVFLNRTISTITHFLDATKQVSLKPLRYFSSAHSKKPMKGHTLKRKPDIILLPLIDGFLPDTEDRKSVV